MNENLRARLDKFDVRSWLEDKGPYHQTEGKNVSSGWITLRCPWCDDPSNHLGIGPHKQVTCFKCGPHGNVIDLIRSVENCDFSQALVIVDEYQDFALTQLKADIQIRSNDNILPTTARPEFSDYYRAYLLRRRYDPDFVIQKYKLLAGPNFGDWAWRIVAPCIINKHVVNFTAIDTTGKKSDKYKNCPNNLAIIPTKNCLYNLDNVNRRAMVVEGILDAWRIGDGAVATFGTQFSIQQVKLLKSLKLNAIFIMFDSAQKDPNAPQQAQRLCNELTYRNATPHVEVLNLTTGDPDDLTDEAAQNIRNEFL